MSTINHAEIEGALAACRIKEENQMALIPMSAEQKQAIQGLADGMGCTWHEAAAAVMEKGIASLYQFWRT